MEKPTLPKGTRDFGPAVMAKRQYIFDTIRSVFQTYGFQPLETPAMENLTTLTGKYGDEGDQLLFRILNSGDFLKGIGTDSLSDHRALSPQIAEKGLRYDLTVPFARYVVMNRNEVSFPFKRYQIQPVWRADRPQKGRYREFYQCDADVVGTDSLLCEAEIILMIRKVFERLGITDYTIKINHRDVLNAIAEVAGARGKEVSLFVAIDKLDKIGWDKVSEELRTKGFSEESLKSLSNIIGITGPNSKKLESLEVVFFHGQAETGKKGISDLQKIFKFVESLGGNMSKVEFDIPLARGLSYYTGCIFEVKINNVAIGSVSGGGRYDNLTAAFGDKDNLPGVGFSFGVDRIYDAMEELNLFPKNAHASSKALVCHFDEESFRYGLGILSSLREAGIASEIYPEPARIRKQLDYANKKQIPFTLVIGSEEMTSGLIAFKDLGKGEQEKLYLDTIIQRLSRP